MYTCVYVCVYIYIYIYDLALVLAAHLLRAVLAILAGTTAQLLLLHVNAGAHLTVLGLELLHLVKALVDEAESRATAAAELRLEAEELDALVIVHLVHLRQLRGKVLLGDICRGRVDDVEHELLAPQQGVLLELARADGEVAHGC